MGSCFFCVHSFADREWGYGDEDPVVLHPGEFDGEQIVPRMWAAGLRGLILTSKRYDGFCFWPWAFPEHSVKPLRWREGRGAPMGLGGARARGGICREQMLDDRRQTVWCLPDEVQSAWVEFRWLRRVRFPVVELREFLPLGPRMD